MFGVYVLYLLVLVEILSRVFLAVRYDASFFEPQDYIYHFYPELKTAEEGLAKGSYDGFRVLILGGSVISHKYSVIDSLLYERLKGLSDRRVELYNVAVKAHTSLDSYHKYRYLKNTRFDLVAIYQGINELRTNNCPDDMFRDDYSHCAWYRELNTFDSHPELSVVTFPVALNLLYSKAKESLGIIECIPRHEPAREMFRYGIDIKSAGPFRHNISGILDMAQDKSEKVLLMTFAYHIPANYTRERFDNKMLDYSEHMHPIELWGSPVGIHKGLEIHNAIIRELSREYPFALLVDQANLLVKGRDNFDDVCYLARPGAEEFVDNMLGDLPNYLWAAE